MRADAAGSHPLGFCAGPTMIHREMHTISAPSQTLYQEALRRLRALPQGMLACPDSGAPLEVGEDALRCPATGREFEPVEGVPAALPEGFEFSDELRHEDNFYVVESAEQTFPRAHRIAHRHGRRPIAEACRRMGIGSDHWVLDVGAGAGSHDLELLRPFTEQIVCIDISPTAAHRFLEREPYACLLATLENLPFTDNSFDAVVISGVIHHVAGYGQMEPYLRAVYKVLKPGQPVICVEPNLLYPTALPMAMIDLVAQRVRPGWRHHVPHERPLVPSRLAAGFRGAGFDQVELLGTSYVHNKMPWPMARVLDSTTTDLAKRPFFRHFGYWIGCVARKPLQEAQA